MQLSNSKELHKEKFISGLSKARKKSLTWKEFISLEDACTSSERSSQFFSLKLTSISVDLVWEGSYVWIWRSHTPWTLKDIVIEYKLQTAKQDCKKKTKKTKREFMYHKQQEKKIFNPDEKKSYYLAKKFIKSVFFQALLFISCVSFF